MLKRDFAISEHSSSATCTFNTVQPFKIEDCDKSFKIAVCHHMMFAKARCSILEVSFPKLLGIHVKTNVRRDLTIRQHTSSATCTFNTVQPFKIEDCDKSFKIAVCHHIMLAKARCPILEVSFPNQCLGC